MLGNPGQETSDLDNSEDLFDEDNLLDMLYGNPSKSGRFPSASRLAEAFDLMDNTRPSLTSRIKGQGKKKGKMFDLSDAELESEMQYMWTKDRESKRLKKAELLKRKQIGMSSPGKPVRDLRLLYDDGMSMKDVRFEIKMFLLSDRDRSVPPVS